LSWLLITKNVLEFTYFGSSPKNILKLFDVKDVQS
jgi:hypothetical protein